MNELRENYNRIIENVEKAKQKTGRSSDNVQIMAVTKTRSIDIVRSAYDVGFRLFGENRIQEATEKFPDFHKDAELHIIGHLQSNKVKKAVDISSCIESVDRLKIAAMINKDKELIAEVKRQDLNVKLQKVNGLNLEIQKSEEIVEKAGLLPRPVL